MKKYLLEHYPTIQNTHIMWVLPLAILGQVLFFIGGFCIVNNDTLKDKYYNIYYDGVPLILNLILSALLLVTWLIYLFRNNAIHHFYPLKARQLFGQFISYFLIILLSTSFTVSFFVGQKAKAYWHYTDNYIEQVLQKYPMYEHNKHYSQEQLDEYYIAENAQRLKQKVINYYAYEQLEMYAVLSFFMAMMLFCIRTTGLRIFLYSVVFAGVLILLLTMLMMLFISITESTSHYRKVYAIGLFPIAYIAILVLSYKLQGKIRKLFSGILLNISMAFFGLALFFVGHLLIKAAYHYIYLANRPEGHYNYETSLVLSDWLDFFTEPYSLGYYLLQGIFVLVVMLFTALYTRAVLRWKALPE